MSLKFTEEEEMQEVARAGMFAARETIERRATASTDVGVMSARQPKKKCRSPPVTCSLAVLALLSLSLSLNLYLNGRQKESLVNWIF